MNRLKKQLAGSMKALCAATLIVCAAPTWAWTPSTHTHVATMNNFTSWYTSTFRPAARLIAAEAIVAAPVVYPGLKPTAQQLANDPVWFEQTLGFFNSTQLSNLMTDFRRRLESRSATASWGANYRTYKASGLFTSSQLNHFNQIYQPNLHIYIHFLNQANPTLASTVVTTVSNEEVIDDRRLTSGYNMGGTVELKDDRVSVLTETSIQLGTARKRIERANLVNERSGIATLVWGPRYTEQSKINHGTTISPVNANYEHDNNVFQHRYYLRGSSTSYAVEVQSKRFDIGEQNIAATITYYVDADIDRNGAFPGSSVAESKRDLRSLTNIATKEMGDPYLGYAMAQYALRTGGLGYLAFVRGQISVKRINFGALATVYNTAVDADTVISAATRSAAASTAARITQTRNYLAAIATAQLCANAMANYHARQAVLNNPNATAEQQKEAARTAYTNVYRSLGGFGVQMAALGAYNFPTQITTTSYNVVKNWGTYFIPMGFAASDMYAAVNAMVDVYRDNRGKDPGEVKLSSLFTAQAAALRGVGAMWTMGDYMARWWNWAYRPGANAPWTINTTGAPIVVNTFTTAFAALSSAAALGFFAIGL